VIGPDDASKERLLQIVKQRIPDAPLRGRVKVSLSGERGSLPIEYQARVDKSIARALAKIVFNYLAHIAGRDFVLDPAFNGIRTFIRDGCGKMRSFVSVKPGPMLTDAVPGVTRGHLVAVWWHQPLVSDEVRGAVSPFSGLVYEVRLCDRYSGVWRESRSGHCFDWKSRTIKPISP
jgi:hypothetical protein